MRAACLSLAMPLIAACGNAGAKIVAPTEGPAGSGDAVHQFFSICGSALNSGSTIDGIAAASEFGWRADGHDQPGAAISKHIHKVTSIKFENASTSLTIGIGEHEDANEKLINCSLSGTNDGELLFDPAIFDTMEGFQGGLERVENLTVGRWSMRSGNTVLNLFTQDTGGRYSSLSMTKFTLK